MGEEAADAEYDRIAAVAGEDGDDDGRVLEWEIGLPSMDELTPLSQSLVPPALASAFRINPEAPKSLLDVHRASHHTISNLRRVGPSSAASAALGSFHPFPYHPSADALDDEDDTVVFEEEDEDEEEDVAGSKDAGGADSSRKVRRMGSPSSSLAAAAAGESGSSAARIASDDQSAKTLKRPRLVWTPQLHKRFVDVVRHLGIKNAVPKTIMQLMNVEGLSRENVASHLQKYRLYLKRIHGMTNEGPSPSDQLFASTPAPYVVPSIYPMPMFGMAHPHGPGKQMGAVPVNKHQVPGACHGFEPHHLYGAFGELSKNWSGGKQFCSSFSYPRVTPSDK